MDHDVVDETLPEEDFNFHSLRTATIYLIDGTHSMFTEKPLESDESAAFVVSLKCAVKTLKSQIFGSPKDLFGIIVYGLHPDFKTPVGEASQYPGVHILVELAPSDVPAITAIEQLLKDPELMGFKPSETPCSDHPLQLAEAFWLSSKLFENKLKNGDKTVVLFTARNEPDITRDQKKQAELRASDLMDAGARIEVVGMSREFDFLPFYKDLVAAPGTEESENLWKPPNNVKKLDDLLNQVVTLSRTRRPRGKIDFNISENFKVSMGRYSLVREATMPGRVQLDRRTNEILETVTAKYSADAEQPEEGAAEFLMRSDVVKYQEFGGARIRLRIDEHRSLRRMGKPGLDLLGFKPRSMIDTSWFHRPCDFLYPEESVIKGSRLFIAALLNRLKAQDKVAICRLIANTNSLPHLVALFPQEEILDETGQKAPPGFHVFYLPYADDIRDIDLVELAGGGEIQRATEEQTDVAKIIVQKLNLECGFKPDLFPNPAIQKLWINIESMALDKEPQEFKDYTVIPPEIVEKKIGGPAEDLKALVAMEVPEEKKAYKKPAYHAEDGGSSCPTAPKKSRSSGDVGADDAESLLKSGNGTKLTVSQLKEYLTSKDVKFVSKAKKQDLIDLALEQLSEAKTE